MYVHKITRLYANFSPAQKIIVRNTGRFAGSTSRSMRNGTCQINCILNERLRCLVVDETEFLKVIRRNSGRKETKLF